MSVWRLYDIYSFVIVGYQNSFPLTTFTLTFVNHDLTIIYDVAASSDNTPQGSLEKKPLQTATFPNGFEVYSYSFLLFTCKSYFLLVKNDSLVGISNSILMNTNTLCYLLEEINTRYLLLMIAGFYPRLHNCIR